MTAEQDISDSAFDEHLRPAEPDEAAALTALALSSKASWGYDADFMARCRDIMTISPAAIARHPYYVVETKRGELLGFYGFDLVDQLLILEWLFVTPAAQGRGLGGALFRHAVSVAAAGGYASFQMVSDPHAEPFYCHQGAYRCGSAPSDLYPGRFLPILRFDLVPRRPITR